MAGRSTPARLEAAVVGYRARLALVNAAVADLQKLLEVREGDSSAVGQRIHSSAGRKRQLSPEGRAQIAEAQRRQVDSGEEGQSSRPNRWRLSAECWMTGGGRWSVTYTVVPRAFRRRPCCRSSRHSISRWRI